MKSIFKILVLGVVPILMATAVVDQGLAADKGSQLIFHTNMYHKNFISVTNANPAEEAVTVLTQYYNDEMKLVLWYLRVLPQAATVLVDPFDHMIPGTASDDDMDGTNVSEVFDALPEMSTDKKAGKNSGRFVIAVTAVGANSAVDDNGDGDTADDGELNVRSTVNVLFPTALAKDMHGTDNIDNCGVLIRAADDGDADTKDTPLVHSEHGEKGVDDCSDGTGARAGDVIPKDPTSKNVGDLNVDNAEPIAFNHLTGHFTEALISTAAGGSDQTASWAGTPVTRPGVNNTDNMTMLDDYKTLNGVNTDAETDPFGGRLAEKDGGATERIIVNTVAGYTSDGGNKIENGTAYNRGLTGGGVVLSALHGGGEETQHVIPLLSLADDFGDTAKGKGGDYKLISAMTGYKVTLMDNMGDALPDPAAADAPIFGGVDDPETPAGVSIIVNGIQVMTDADLAKCTGTMMNGAWSLASLTSIVPSASTGMKDFAGLDAMMDPMMNATPGWVKFARSDLTCKKDYGDGDSADGSSVEDDDGVPTKDERTYKAGTLIAEQPNTDRAFVITGQAVLKFLTPDSTFAGSWSLKSPPSVDNPDRAAIDQDGTAGADGIPADILTGRTAF